MSTRLNKLKLNTIFGILYQISLVLVNIFLPRFFLKYYGSNVNGLVSSITQFLSFINIADMGIGAVVSSALYKPLAEKDYSKINGILAFSRKFFRIVGLILIGYVLLLTFLYPLIVAKSFSFLFTVTLLWAMCLSQFGQFFVGITYSLLLNADQKSYVQLIINMFTVILNAIVSILIMRAGVSIQIVKLSTSLIFLLRPVYLYFYVKKHYDIDNNAKPNGKLIPQKRGGIIQHISYTVYQNTDIVVLTLFSSLANVSIYSVYVLVNNGLKSLITALTTGFMAMFGNMLAKNERKKLYDSFELYDWIIHTICSLIYTLSGILIVPFILTYTRGILDANYNVPIFALLITLSYACNTIRESMFVLIKAAGHYEQTQIASLFEAIINIFVSIIFVFKFGLIGVAVGTLTATCFFLLYEVFYLSKHIVTRTMKKFFHQILVDIISVILILIFTSWIHINEYSYIVWARNAILAFIISVVLVFLINIIFYKNNIKKLYSILRMGIGKRF